MLVEHPLLCGRDDAVRRILAVLDATAHGQKRGCVLLGGSGLGKTMLLREASTLALDRGFITASIRVPAQAPIANDYPFLDLMTRLGHAATNAGVSSSIDQLGKVAQGSPAPSISQWAEDLDELGRLRSIALFVDDAHLASGDGITTLNSIIRAMDAPIALFLTARLPTDSDTALPQSSGDLWFDTIELEPLDRSSVAKLGEVMLGAPLLPTSADTLHDATGGNPLHAVETIRDGVAEGWLTARGGHWVIGEGFRPRSVLESVATRIARLNADELAVASVLAVLGRSSDLKEILSAVTLDSQAAVEALALLADAGLVTTDLSLHQYRLTTPLHVTAVLESVGPIRRGSIHEAVLATLRDHGASPDELAHHAVSSHNQPADLHDLLRAAAGEAEAAGNPAQAAGWFARLVEASEGTARSEALSAQARTTAQFDPGQSIQLFTQAMEGASDVDVAVLLTQRARAHQRIGKFAEALADLEHALPIAGAQDRFSVEAGLAVVTLLTGLRAEAQERMIALERSSVGTSNHARALYHVAAACSYMGDVDGFVEHSRASLHESADPHLRRSAQNNVIWGLILQGHWAQAHELIHPAIAELESLHDDGSLFALLNNAAIMYAWKGDTVAALDLGVRLESIAERIGNPTDRLKAQEAIVLALLEGGDAPGAAQLLPGLQALIDETTEAREINFTYLVMGDTYLAVGNTDAASACCDQAEALLEVDSLLWSEATARLRSKTLLASGEVAKSIRLVEPWIESAGSVAIEHAGLLEVAGRATHAAGSRRDGFELIGRAHEAYDQLGAARRAGVTKSWMVVNEAKRVGRPRSQLPAGLTEREVQILGLLVRGKSNRQIAEALVVSPATVKTHVERILGKTGAARRSELSMIAVRLGLDLPFEA